LSVFCEDDEQFDAGKGDVFNAVGGHELDASIMDGKSGACGGVAGVTTVRNPVSQARKVMTETRHVLLAGMGAEKFADEMQLERVENRYFDTPDRRKAWETRRSANTSTLTTHDLLPELESYAGTVGCCALEKNGNLAAATSTGGLTNKMFGRVGDSPIAGAGKYASSDSCAVSCTGVGEQLIRHAVAHDVSARMKYLGNSLRESTQSILKDVLKPGEAGIIAIDRNGTIVMDFNTSGMARAAADSTGYFEVIWHKSSQE